MKKHNSLTVSEPSVREILAAFNTGQLDATTAAERLMISRPRLYELRYQWLTDQQTFPFQPSGGDPHPAWPAAAHTFLGDFLPDCQPLNFALAANELARRFDFHRPRATRAAYVRQHFPPRPSPSELLSP